MRLAPRQRQVVLALVFGATLLAVRWTAEREAEAAVAEAPDLVEAAPARRGDASLGEALPPLELERLTRRPVAGEPAAPLFAGQRPPAPSAGAARSAPPPAPTAPTPPFAYMGKVIDAGQVIVFLSVGSRNYVARAGDFLDNVWRVDETAERRMTLTYLPLNSRHYLSLGTDQ